MWQVIERNTGRVLGTGSLSDCVRALREAAPLGLNLDVRKAN